MPTDPQTLLTLRVPVIVAIGRRRLNVDDVLSLVPGAIIELDKQADDPLDLRINNKSIATGAAVKVGENYGIKIDRIHSAESRIRALGS